MLRASEKRNPVTYGSIRRGQPTEVHLRVHPDADLDDLLDDWRGFHEFAHLLLPFAGNADIWFAEGLAAFAECCMDSAGSQRQAERRTWSARRLIAQLDRSSTTEVWTRVHEQMISAPAEPDLDWAMDQLGIRWDGREIGFTDDPAKAPAAGRNRDRSAPGPRLSRPATATSRKPEQAGQVLT